jgi:hypothetical protein
MKCIFLTMIFFASAFASAKSFQELEGRYNVKILLFNAEIDLSASGHATLIRGSLTCEGEAEIKGSAIAAPFDCNDGRSTHIEIDLKNVNEYSKFKAPVKFAKVGTFKGSFTKLQ